MKSRPLFLIPILIFAPLLLTGCTGSMDPRGYLEQIGHLPLWHKMTAIALATIVSEDLVCIATGLLSSEGVISLSMGMLACFLGIFLCDIPFYLMGRWGGIDLLRKRPFRWWMKEQQIVQTENLFHSHGAKLIFSSRLVPGSRLPVYAAAGVLNFPFWKFLLYKAIAGGVSTVVLVWLSHHLGDRIIRWLKFYESYFIPSLIALFVGFWAAVKLFEILATRRSRLLFLARMRRWRGRPRRAMDAER